MSPRPLLRTAILSLLMTLPSAVALADGTEGLYLADSGSTRDGTTVLFTVALDATTGAADLTELGDAGFGAGVIPFNQVDAIAVTPDGEELFAIDRYSPGKGPASYPALGSGALGRWDIQDSEWKDLGLIEESGVIVEGIVLAVFDGAGTLYAASVVTNSLYTVDTDTAEAVLVGPVVNAATGQTVNVSGADLVFDASGALYIWSNFPTSVGPSPRGLYLLDLPVGGWGDVAATLMGPAQTGFSVTGLAWTDGGLGDLVASTTADEVVVLDPATGLVGDSFAMLLGNAPYAYSYGDMSVGALAGGEDGDEDGDEASDDD